MSRAMDYVRKVKTDGVNTTDLWIPEGEGGKHSLSSTVMSESKPFLKDMSGPTLLKK